MTDLDKQIAALSARRSAPCDACFWVAVAAIDSSWCPDEHDAQLLAREWLYDRGALSACPQHEHLLG